MVMDAVIQCCNVRFKVIVLRGGCCLFYRSCKIPFCTAVNSSIKDKAMTLYVD